jgi:hypothetical protein
MIHAGIVFFSKLKTSFLCGSFSDLCSKAYRSSEWLMPHFNYILKRIGSYARE